MSRKATGPKRKKSQVFTGTSKTFHIFRKYSMETKKEPFILNDILTDQNEMSINIVEKLESIISRIADEFTFNENSSIKYEKLKSSNLWTEEFLTLTPLFRTMDLEDLTNSQKKSFFINLYNCLGIHRILSNENIPDSCNDLLNFWRTSAYIVANNTYSLADIMNGILRGNKPRPTSDQNQFDDADMRIKFVLKPDPRVLFALSTFSQSSPAINAYTGLHLDDKLNEVTSKYLNQTLDVTVEVGRKEVIMPPFFQWYKDDFGGLDLDSLRWSMKYLNEDKTSGINSCLDEGADKVCISFSDYDWSINNFVKNA